MKSSDILSRLQPALVRLNHNFLILMTVVNRAGFAGRLPEVLAPVLANLQAREAAANNPPPLAMEVPEPLAEQPPDLGDDPREGQVAAEPAPVEEEPLDPANVFEVETPVRDEEMDNAVEEQDLLSLHSTRQPLTASHKLNLRSNPRSL